MVGKRRYHDELLSLITEDIVPVSPEIARTQRELNEECYTDIAQWVAARI